MDQVKSNQTNIVLILFDSMRTNNLSFYGYDKKTTPTFEKLSEQGVRFENAFVQAPFTVASTASILTSVYPSVHHLEYYGQRLAENLITFPEVLQATGYYTAGFVANPHINPESGLTRGFTHFTDGRPWYKRLPGLKHLSAWAESGKALNRSVEKTLKEVHNQPFFFFVFYNDSHVPFSDLPRIFLPLAGKKYHSPDFERIKYTDEEMAKVKDLYDQALHRADQRLAELLQLIQQSPFADNTVFIISADHGEGLDRRQERAGHGRLYDNGIHVPLVVWAPTLQQSGKVADDLVTGLDLAPTICQWAGIEPPSHWQGMSLASLVDGLPALAARSYVISEYHDSRAVRTKRWKSIYRGSGIGSLELNGLEAAEVYDLERDPNEEVNIKSEYPEAVANHNQILREFISTLHGNKHTASTFEADSIVLERLRGLGYVD